jgi:heme oxygenase (staphylobilin-producing)
MCVLERYFFVEEGVIMFVISRVFKCQKREHSIYKDYFLKQSPLDHFKGFIKKELLINDKDKDFDIVRLYVFFESKKAFYEWEGSPMHIALHKDKSSSHHQKLEGVMEVYAEKYESLGSVKFSYES